MTEISLKISCSKITITQLMIIPIEIKLLQTKTSSRSSIQINNKTFTKAQSFSRFIASHILSRVSINLGEFRCHCDVNLFVK